MRQVGHADSKLTLDVYAKLEQRIQRDHGTGFDQLVRQARVQLASMAPACGARGPHSPRPVSTVASTYVVQATTANTYTSGEEDTGRLARWVRAANQGGGLRTKLTGWACHAHPVIVDQAEALL